jgi:membrane-bound serine protease (ClpP class)
MPRLILILLLLLIAAPLSAQPSNVVVLEVEGVIGPASKDYILRGLATAQERNADLVVMKMDTPGGLDNSMRDIIRAILASPIPVATFVHPSGSRAASAGTYILYASHIAAMAPGTNLGAATPVQMGGGGLPDFGQDDDPQEAADDEADDARGDDNGAADNDEDARSEQTSPSPRTGDTAMERKMVNDAKAYIRSLAELRGRNVEWAEQSVVDAASLSYSQALEKNVIDIVARNVEELLEQIDGRTVEINDEPVVLALDLPATLDIIEPDWRNQLLAIITHPQVAYILMLLGIYGLFFEFSNPGALVPGVLGGICLLLALFAFQVLPINYAGLALIILGLGLMVAEAFAPSFGILGLGGVAAFVAGSILLWEETGGVYELPLGLIIGFAVGSALILIGVSSMVARNYRRVSVTGDQALVGLPGVVLDDLTDQGRVRVQGEIWRAQADHPLPKGARVRVVSRDNLTLRVTAEDD